SDRDWSSDVCSSDLGSDDDGWAHLGGVGNIITKQRPDFDSRTYGYAKLSDLMAATTLFDLERRGPGDGKAAVIYARDNRRRTQSDRKSVVEGKGVAV